jgi:hypothetical protein
MAEEAAGASYNLITVQSHRLVSDEAAMLLLLRDGVPVWSASHFRITAEALKGPAVKTAR